MASTTSFKQMCPSCEALIPIRDPKLIGRKVECPKCKYRFVVEEPEEKEEEAPKKGKKDADKKGAKGEKGEKDAKGKPKGKKDKAKAKKGGGSNMVLIGAGLALVAIVGLVVALMGFSGSDSKPSGGPGGPVGSPGPGGDMSDDTAGGGPKTPAGTQNAAANPVTVDNLTNILPNETESVILFSPEQLQKSALRHALLGTPGGFREDDFSAAFGFSFYDVSQILVARGGEWTFSILRAKKPLDRKGLIARFRMSPEAPVQGLESYVVGRSFDPMGNLLLKGNRERPSFRAHFLDDHTVVFADPQPMQAWLNAGGQPTLITPPPAAPSTPIVPPDPTDGMEMSEGMTEGGMGEMTEGGMGEMTEGGMPSPGMNDSAGQKPKATTAKANWLTLNQELKVLLDKMDDGKQPILLVAHHDVKRALEDLALFKKSSGSVLPLGAPEDTEKQLEAITAVIPLGIKRAGCVVRRLSEDRLVATVSLDTIAQSTAQDIQAVVNKALGLVPTANDPNMFNPYDPMNTEGLPPPEGGPGYVDPTMQPTDPQGKSKPVRILTWGKTLMFNIDAPLKTEAYDELMGRAQMLAVYLKSEASMVGATSRVHDLAAALKKYVDERKQFPRGTAQRDDVGRLAPWAPDQRVSWMAELLPYMNYHLGVQPDLSWNEGPNQRVAQVVIPEFLVPSPDGTRYRVDYPGIKSELAPTHFVGVAGVGLDAAEYPAGNAALAAKLGVFGYDRATTPDQITDGPENTIALLQVPGEHNTPWLAGGGSTVRGVSEDADALAHFGGAVDPKTNKKGAYAIMADFKVRFIPEDIDLDTFRALCTIAGGEKIENLDSIAPVVEGEVSPPMTPAPQTPVSTSPTTTPPSPQPVNPPVTSANPQTPAPMDPPTKNPNPVPTTANKSTFAIRDRAKVMNDFKQIGLGYHFHNDSVGKAPSKVEDLASFINNDPRLVGLIKDGTYVIFWDVRIAALPQGASNTILGYEAGADKSGGVVLMADGSVRRMNTEEFAQAAKPK